MLVGQDELVVVCIDLCTYHLVGCKGLRQHNTPTEDSENVATITER